MAHEYVYTKQFSSDPKVVKALDNLWKNSKRINSLEEANNAKYIMYLGDSTIGPYYSILEVRKVTPAMEKKYDRKWYVYPGESYTYYCHSKDNPLKYWSKPYSPTDSDVVTPGEIIALDKIPSELAKLKK